VEAKGPDDAVFTWPNGKPVESIRDTWARASTKAGLGAMYCKKCDVEVPNEKMPECSSCGRKLTRNEQKYKGLIFHDLRRTAARHMLLAGIPERYIKEIGGWKTTAVFHRYAIVDRRMMTDAIRRLERYREEQKAARAENIHSSFIAEGSEAKNTPPKKLQ
jgi:hypothetical protein